MKTVSVGLFLTLYSTVSTSKYEITRVTKTNALRLCFSGSSLKHQYTGRLCFSGSSLKHQYTGRYIVDILFHSNTLS
jgi:hypothetical protein